jgi:predicted NAD-dependent protein-ADP-ribosyltransferase YbiA (DUF1768 family)
MRIPSETLLRSHGLHVAGVTGFREVVRRGGDRDARVAPDTMTDPRNRVEWRRGADVARAWLALRPAATDEDALLVRAIAHGEGFAHPDPLLVDAVARRVHPGDIGYVEREVVAFFHAEARNGILAPTHPTSIEHGGATWTSSEALYQAQKHSDPEFRERIRLAPDALSAKAVSKERDPDLPTMRDHFRPGRRVAMVRALVLRHEQDAEFRTFLGRTMGLDIVEHVHDGGDARWGVIGRGGLRGWNLQGRLLSALRDHMASPR